MKKNLYNYQHFHTDYYEPYVLGKFEGPNIGQEAPDFTAPDIEGNQVRLGNFRGEIVILETGSITCPLTLGNTSLMYELVKKYPEIVFLLLYVREAHPGNKRPAHKSIEDKVSCAKRLKLEEKENRIVIVDNLEGEIHQKFGSLPNEVYVIDKNGVVAYRAQNNDPRELDKILEVFTKGENKKFSAAYEAPVMPPIKYFIRAAKRAGWRALFDALVGIPKVIVGLLKRKIMLDKQGVSNQRKT